MLCGEGGKTLAQVSQRGGKCFIQMLHPNASFKWKETRLGWMRLGAAPLFHQCDFMDGAWIFGTFHPKLFLSEPEPFLTDNCNPAHAAVLHGLPE